MLDLSDEVLATLKARDVALIQALLEGSTWREAARRAGYSRATLYRRRQDAGFPSALRAVRRAYLQGTVREMVRRFGEGLDRQVRSGS